MADDDGGGTNLFQDMFKSFPVFTIIMISVLVYMLWVSTGGIERGEDRRANGEDSLFVEVTGVPSAFENQELFGTVSAEKVEETFEEE